MMNIFHKVTLQSMKKSRTRTIVTVIGVILSAAMITAVTTFSVSLLNYMIKGATVKYGGWHVEFLDVDSSFAEARARAAGVAGTAISENIGYAELKGGKNPNKPYLFIAGFSKVAFDTVPIELVSGRLPENSGEIVVPAHVAANPFLPEMSRGRKTKPLCLRNKEPIGLSASAKDRLSRNLPRRVIP